MAPEAVAPVAAPQPMVVVDGLDALTPSLGRLFVVVGVFDGLHLGHLYLLQHLRSLAAQRNAQAAVVTFDHHPDEILTGAAPPLLCDPQERLERLEAAGVAVTVVQTFDLALRITPFDAFVRRISDRAPLAGFLMTPDAAFGFERRGTVDAVTELGRSIGYEVVVIPPFDVDGQPVRSADIRTAIANGDLSTAARLLGRDVSVTGRVEPVGEERRLAFDLPVALPPTGEYHVVAVAALGPGRQLVRGTGMVTIAGPESVLLQVDGIPSGERTRITFATRE